MTTNLPWVGLLLAFAGGTTDAYSYLMRDKVFANTITGNVVMLAYYTPQGRFDVYPRYLIPMLAFFLGVLFGESLRMRTWPQSSRRREAVASGLLVALLAAVGFMPATLNLLATSCIAFACGVQIVTYPQVNGLDVSTTMCTANLRRTGHWFFSYLQTRDVSDFRRMLYFLELNLSFALGAVVQALIVGTLGTFAILPAVLVHLFLWARVFFPPKTQY